MRRRVRSDVAKITVSTNGLQCCVTSSAWWQSSLLELTYVLPSRPAVLSDVIGVVTEFMAAQNERTVQMRRCTTSHTSAGVG
jgi:hypothetical protein